MIKNICRVIRRYIIYARSNNVNLCTKNYDYIYIKYILYFSGFPILFLFIDPIVLLAVVKMRYVSYLLLLFLAVGWDFLVRDFIFMCEKMIYQLKRKYYKTVRTYVGLISWDHLGTWDQSGPDPSQTFSTSSVEKPSCVASVTSCASFDCNSAISLVVRG